MLEEIKDAIDLFKKIETVQKNLFSNNIYFVSQICTIVS